MNKAKENKVLSLEIARLQKKAEETRQLIAEADALLDEVLASLEEAYGECTEEGEI